MDTPIWQPSSPENSNLWRFMRFVEKLEACKFSNYANLYAWSIQYPERFWEYLSSFFKVKFNTPPTAIFTPGKNFIHARWFTDATFNVAEALLSRQDSHLALVCIQENGQREELSYRELRAQVAACAAGLTSAGVSVGDRVVGILSNGKYAIIAMLASASIGAIWSSCSPDFGVDALLDRITQLNPKVLFINDGQIYNGKRITNQAKISELLPQLINLKNLVICPVINHTTSMQKTTTWHDFLKPCPSLTFTSLPFNHPFVILFSSGTTGKPKGIVHGAGGTYLQHIKELALHTNLSADDRLCFYTTCGWMMWNWMVSGLALGVTLILYDGSPTAPHTERLFEIIDQEQVTVFGTSAKFLSTIEHSGKCPNETYALKNLKTILSTGSPLLPKQYTFVAEKIKANVQLSSISGGTDIISCFALGNPLTPVYPGELQCIGLGMAVKIFNDQGQIVPCNTQGELVCTQPFPSMPIAFWNDPQQINYHRAYFERFQGVWAHGDFAALTNNHGLVIYGRSDTLLNPGGVRIGTAEIYRQIEPIHEIVDSVVIGQQWQDDIRIILFVQLQKGLYLTNQLEKYIKDILRTNASPRHVPAKIIQVNDIPKTLNGKIVELAVSQIVHKKPVLQKQSLANPDALEEFENRVELET